MKAISLWQPWATLIPLQQKKFETRSWSTDYRGPIAIHAAKKWDRSLYAISKSEPFKTSLGHYGDDPDSLPRGCFVAVADLVEVHPVYDVCHRISYQERCFGNYGPGRFAWQFENIRAIDPPIAGRGYQGLWNLPDDIAELLKSSIAIVFHCAKEGCNNSPFTVTASKLELADGWIECELCGEACEEITEDDPTWDEAFERIRAKSRT